MPLSQAATFALDGVPASGGGLNVRLHGVRHAAESFEILFFLNLPEGQEAGAAHDSPHFAGSLFMYGLGAPEAEDEHAPDTAPFDMELAVPPDVVERAARAGTNQLAWIARTPDGRHVDTGKLQLKGLSIRPG